ncbi:TAT-variant-translocated molybdopterin oxidoreductase [Mesorhizobium sp. BAC0120]|uniref:TAT-variant-translocated molybdopterin oxidoreductase n=1 Tax=Mesorhizobium sp. BAC0120 TaxID=3090670 RepID=UPI00298D59B9|nr:TAT-variant-translocated molybdopterin oxidoreductase [Mesorhizobium sp. BAC0120]MDW6023544.1 TAT-variant-translocated molybdopterin oxidoreductase [Mesorhizobium sp. BAC0120]
MAGENRNDPIAAMRSHLRGKTGRAFWRSLDELADTAAFRTFLEAEFPPLSGPSDIDRRSMLKVMAASLALAGLTGCGGSPDQTALPYVEAPEFVVPGKPKWYATAVTLGGFVLPALGKTHVGRPVKLEGNRDHPASGGATDAFLQASLLGLYDPDRSQSPRILGRPTSWSSFDAAITAGAAELDRRQGEGFRLLTGSVTSPTMLRQIEALLSRWAQARWHVLEPINDDLALEAARRVFARPLDRHLMLDVAEVVISLDDDFLGPGPRQSVQARRWSTRRLAFQERRGDSRLFVAEPTPSLTGAMAEDRLIASPSRVEALGYAIAAALGVDGASAPELADEERRWVDRAVAALRKTPGKTLLTVGPQHSAELQALGLLCNERIGALGATLRFTDPIAAIPPDGIRSLDMLAQDMAAGRVTTLAVVGANPAYTAPVAPDFRAAMEKVPLRLHVGLHYDETASLSHWHVPLAHELESWSDARAVDGTASIQQPLIRPFYDVRPLHVVMDNLVGSLGGSDRDRVQETWRASWGESFDGRWRNALVRGFVEASAAPFVASAVADRSVPPHRDVQRTGLTVVFRPDPTIWDGRFASNPWLQETPKQLTKITWGNVILVSPALAKERRLQNGDVLQLEAGGRTLTGPAWIMPGQEANTVTVTLGYGRTHAGRVGSNLGYDAFAIRTSDSAWRIEGAALSSTGKKEIIATTQAHQALDGFDFVRTVGQPDAAGSRPDTVPGPNAAGEQNSQPPSFYPTREWDSPSWGMAIDLDLCIGCNACVVACMAENNVPVVGKELVAEGRQMHWLRIDQYYEGDPAQPKSYFQPVPCMHCEQAPCEMGCPVNAAVHSFDGLNLQVYNRCVGTRTCSSFCPYKVRRFNWFDYTGDDPEELRAARNPDVTIRSRGVMEKCTYCVQRISEARIAAKIEGRAIRDGDVVTACQQACPTRAITFGDVIDPETQVSRRKASPRNYSLLEEANTRPRTTYLARIESTGGGAEDGTG